jgi:hypothetical protein
MGLKKEEMGDEEQVDHGHRKKKGIHKFLTSCHLPATLPNHPSTSSTFSHLKFIIQEDKCMSIIEDVKKVCENKKWAARIELFMNSQKIIHISLSPLRAFHQTLMFSILGYQASYVTLIKL